MVVGYHHFRRPPRVIFKNQINNYQTFLSWSPSFLFFENQDFPKTDSKTFPTILPARRRANSFSGRLWLDPSSLATNGETYGETKTGRVFLPQKISSCRPICANSISICKPWINRVWYIFTDPWMVDDLWFMGQSIVGIYLWWNMQQKKKHGSYGIWIRFHLNFGA